MVIFLYIFFWNLFASLSGSVFASFCRRSCRPVVHLDVQSIFVGDGTGSDISSFYRQSYIFDIFLFFGSTYVHVGTSFCIMHPLLHMYIWIPRFYLYRFAIGRTGSLLSIIKMNVHGTWTASSIFARWYILPILPVHDWYIGSTGGRTWAVGRPSFCTGDCMDLHHFVLVTVFAIFARAVQFNLQGTDLLLCSVSFYHLLPYLLLHAMYILSGTGIVHAFWRRMASCGAWHWISWSVHVRFRSLIDIASWIFVFVGTSLYIFCCCCWWFRWVRALSYPGRSFDVDGTFLSVHPVGAITSDVHRRHLLYIGYIVTVHRRYMLVFVQCLHCIFCIFLYTVHLCTLPACCRCRLVHWSLYIDLSSSTYILLHIHRTDLSQSIVSFWYIGTDLLSVHGAVHLFVHVEDESMLLFCWNQTSISSIMAVHPLFGGNSLHLRLQTWTGEIVGG